MNWIKFNLMPEVRFDGLIILKQHERNISEKALYPLIRQTSILYDLLNQNSPLKYKSHICWDLFLRYCINLKKIKLSYFYNSMKINAHCSFAQGYYATWYQHLYVLFHLIREMHWMRRHKYTKIVDLYMRKCKFIYWTEYTI